jgi:hypothetical protein
MSKTTKEASKATRWFNVEAVGPHTKRFIRFALEEAQKSKVWTCKQLAEKGMVVGQSHEWQATQLRRRYLAGKPVLHSIPGRIFERAILDAVQRVAAGETEASEDWNTIILAPREGWVGERGPRVEAPQKFSFSGDLKAVVRGHSDARAVTPEKAEYQFFYENELAWKWGSLRLGGDVLKGVKSTLHHWHIPFRGLEGFFNLVEEFELHRVNQGSEGVPEKWQLRIIFK